MPSLALRKLCRGKVADTLGVRRDLAGTTRTVTGYAEVDAEGRMRVS